MNCSSQLGYLPRSDQMQALPLNTAGATPEFAQCANRHLIGCNWLCDGPGAAGLCLSCQRTTKIPFIGDQSKRKLWARLEVAKRRLFYALLKFGLPLKGDTPQTDLKFEFLGDHFHPNGKPKRVMTGHSSGLITINIAEADDAIREKTRTAMGEPYRTIVGHFRHELAHFYWDRLIAGRSVLAQYRALFGDERQDYAAALTTYYAQGPRADWAQYFVSAYASAHPWEDFAETWAHYFHMVGGLETAFAYGLNPQPLNPGGPVLIQSANPYHEPDIGKLIAHWVPLTVAMNAMNRSMGNSDYYPFVLSRAAAEKLGFVHDLIAAQ